jgi:regulatory protein
VPEAVVVRCGLSAGVALERPLLRRLRSELRRAEALEVAGRALKAHDLSSRRLTERLERAGVPAAEREAMLAVLERTGLVDDARVASARAVALCERGWGDTAIRVRLAQGGFPDELAAAAVASLPPEGERAARLVAGIAEPARAARLLSRRGFGDEVAEAAMARLDADS